MTLWGHFLICCLWVIETLLLSARLCLSLRSAGFGFTAGSLRRGRHLSPVTAGWKQAQCLWGLVYFCFTLRGGPFKVLSKPLLRGEAQPPVCAPSPVGVPSIHYPPSPHLLGSTSCSALSPDPIHQSPNMGKSTGQFRVSSWSLVPGPSGPGQALQDLQTKFFSEEGGSFPSCSYGKVSLQQATLPTLRVENFHLSLKKYFKFEVSFPYSEMQRSSV